MSPAPNRFQSTPAVGVQAGFAGVLALLLIAYWPVLVALAAQWQSDEDVAHGMFAPVVAIYFLWLSKEEIAAAPVRPSWWGLVILLASVLLYVVGELAGELFLPRVAFLLSGVGAVIFVRGFPVIRTAVLPIILLLFMIPLPRLVYKGITFPLQLLASNLAERTLEWMNYSVLREGNLLTLAGQQLSVAEACSGLRSLFSLSFLVIVYAHMMESRNWVRSMLLAITIPTAIIANAGRIVITGILGEYDRQLSDGLWHVASGWVVALLGFGLMMCVHRVVALYLDSRGHNAEPD